MQNNSQIVNDGLCTQEDVVLLSEIFEEVFNYFCTHSSPFADDYLREIKTIVGLGFTAVLVNEIYFMEYKNKMRTFLQYCDFRRYPECVKMLSTTIAEMIGLAFNVFYRIKYPPYYKNFLATLIKAINHVSIQLSDKSETFCKFSKALQKNLTYGQNA